MLIGYCKVKQHLKTFLVISVNITIFSLHLGQLTCNLVCWYISVVWISVHIFKSLLDTFLAIWSNIYFYNLFMISPPPKKKKKNSLTNLNEFWHEYIIYVYISIYIFKFILLLLLAILPKT